MPVTKSAYKRLRQSKKRGDANLAVREDLKTTIKKTRQAITKADKETAETLLKSVIKQADKALQHGIIKKNTVARRKSRLVRQFNSAFKTTEQKPAQ